MPSPSTTKNKPRKANNSSQASLLFELGQSQKERLFHLDFKLRFLGSFNRADLVTRFGIKAAAATRDITLYKSISPQNLHYDTKAKSYIASSDFKAVFDYSGSQALSALCHGLGDNYIASNSPLITSETPTQLNYPNLDILAEITKAIHQHKSLKIDYLSLSSGPSTRNIVPFALVDNGLRWHVRAFDCKQERFADFVINRITKTKTLAVAIPASQSKEADIQWNRIVEMHIIPHPSVKHPETIATEYAMQDGKLTLLVRAAVAGYVLRRWNVDCSEQHHLSGGENHLWLQNRQTLYGVENLVIAPGYL